MAKYDWDLYGMSLHHFEDTDELRLLKTIRKWVKETGVLLSSVVIKLVNDEAGNLIFDATVVYC